MATEDAATEIARLKQALAMADDRFREMSAACKLARKDAAKAESEAAACKLALANCDGALRSVVTGRKNATHSDVTDALRAAERLIVSGYAPTPTRFCAAITGRGCTGCVICNTNGEAPR